MENKMEKPDNMILIVDYRDETTHYDFLVDDAEYLEKYASQPWETDLGEEEHREEEHDEWLDEMESLRDWLEENDLSQPDGFDGYAENYDLSQDYDDYDNYCEPPTQPKHANGPITLSYEDWQAEYDPSWNSCEYQAWLDKYLCQHDALHGIWNCDDSHAVTRCSGENDLKEIMEGTYNENSSDVLPSENLCTVIFDADRCSPSCLATLESLGYDTSKHVLLAK